MKSSTSFVATVIGGLIGSILILAVSVVSFSSPEPPELPPTKKELFPYQSSGVERLVADQRVLLADEMGLGKTCQAIGALNRLFECGELHRTKGRVLIISPKSVLNVWVDELESWLDPRLGLDVKVCTAGDSPEEPSTKGIIQLINYDICSKHKDILMAEKYDVLICDEAQYLKSHKSKRTMAILGNCVGGKRGQSKAKGISARYLWLLTGTPIMNRPVELYPLLRAIDPEGWEPFTKFIERYCEPKTYRGKGGKRWGVNASGASNLGELQERLKPYMVRRYKADVLTDLPPKLRSCLNLDGSEAAVQERRMVAEMTGMGNENLYAQGGEGHWEQQQQEGDSNMNLGLESFGAEASTLTHYGIKPSDFEDERFLGKLAKIRKETAMLKLKPAVQLLKDIIACEKVVVFAHHRQLIMDLVEQFGKSCVHIIGGMDSEKRADAVRRFQNDDSCRIFIGSIRAAGVGVTLTAASHVVFLELDWSPAIMAQAEDRCHRVGQRDSVLIHYYVFRDTIDEWIARQLISKEIVTTMTLPTDTDIESLPRLNSGGYRLDFGKHSGLRLEDVPKDYLTFITDTDNGAIYRKRPALWRALARYGLVHDEPPLADEDPIASTSRNGKEEGENTELQVEYTFNFGKHKGLEWNDVPQSYRGWVVRNNVWKTRPELKKALLAAGVIE